MIDMRRRLPEEDMINIRDRYGVAPVPHGVDVIEYRSFGVVLSRSVAIYGPNNAAGFEVKFR